MSKGRLTRHELGWLLAQEARGAAKALRNGVTQLRQEPIIQAAADPPVETSLDALDDAIELLSELEAAPAPRRRGRIDLAALLYESAPGALISIEPGAGTEVFGEERELRRMLHLLVGQSQTETGRGGRFAASEIQIRREGDWIRISVELGPDTSATMELERRWLSRTALRLGGRFALEGGVQTIFLPADGSSNQREVLELRKELAQAQQLGEVYARELATVFGATDSVDAESQGLADLALLQRFAKAASTTLAKGSQATPGEGPPGASWGSLGAQLGELAALELNAAARRFDLVKALRDQPLRWRALGSEAQLIVVAPEAGAEVVAPEQAVQLLLGNVLRHTLDTTRSLLIEATVEAVNEGWRLTLAPKLLEPSQGARIEVRATETEGVAQLTAEKLATWLKIDFTVSHEVHGVRWVLRFSGAPPDSAAGGAVSTS